MLASYLENLVLPELQEAKLDNLSLLKATCIKFIYMFRNQLPDQFVPVFLDKVADFLRSESYVNQSYAAACIEKLLLRRTTSTTPAVPIFQPGNVDPTILTKLLQGLCELLQSSKNLYAVRSLYRTVQLAQDNLVGFAQTLGQVLAGFIDSAARDEAQSSPNYIYILFETSALLLRHLKGEPEVFMQVEQFLAAALNYIMEKNVTDMIGYAFQIYALFVANSAAISPNYKVLTDSILANKANWDKDMKYLIPALGNFLIAMIYKYPEQFLADQKNMKNIQDVVQHLMQPDIRMETTAMSIAGAIFEKLPQSAGGMNAEFIHAFLYSVFTCLHFYRNNTKAKVIPLTITKAIWSCLSNFIIYNGAGNLIAACDKIQPGILFMIMKSEGDKIKLLTGPPAREKKYGIVAFTQVLQQYSAQMPEDVI